MTPFEENVFAAAFACAFVRHTSPVAVAASDEPGGDDDAALVAGDRARRAVEAFRRLMFEESPPVGMDKP
jgi:hypothetical protein